MTHPWKPRVVAEQCPYPGCTSPPLADNCRCERHAEEHRVANRESAFRLRHGIRRRHVQLALEGVG